MICPICKNNNVIKKGQRKTKFEIKQRYFCKDCNKKFTNDGLKDKMYPPRIVYSALNYYDLGFNIRNVSKLINKRYNVRASKSTVHSWIHEFQDLCPISMVRNDFLDYNDVLFTKKFEHETLDYEFMYHKYKLEAIVRERFPGLARYIKLFDNGCPNVFFKVEEQCSPPRFEADPKFRTTKNLACRMTAFALHASQGDNRWNKLVENFMLINDDVTIACGLPVWYWDKKKGIGITGQIEMVQVRNNLVYILDYKPDASKKAPWELYHYAIALSFRAKVHPKSIRCAWFDENVYYEYAPYMASIKPFN